jgi:1-acyl-sn-glycerol-3-phosphate acyltransferase
MVRLILVALTVVLFLLFSMPYAWYLKKKGEKEPKETQYKSLGIVQGVFRQVIRFAGITYEVHGLENIPKDRAVLYVGNHRSYFDIVVGYVTVPDLTGFIAKKEMMSWPLIGEWMKLVNCLFLDRNNIKEGLKTILEGIDKVKNGVSMWIFPEGTRSKSEEITDLLPFKEGSLKIAEKTGCPVIPVAITGTAEVFEKHFPWITPGHVVIRYGEPIDLKALTGDDRKFSGAYVRSVIISMLEEEKYRTEKERV